jgi:hypothetical protein
MTRQAEFRRPIRPVTSPLIFYSGSQVVDSGSASGSAATAKVRGMTSSLYDSDPANSSARRICRPTHHISVGLAPKSHLAETSILLRDLGGRRGTPIGVPMTASPFDHLLYFTLTEVAEPSYFTT